MILDSDSQRDPGSHDASHHEDDFQESCSHSDSYSGFALESFKSIGQRCFHSQRQTTLFECVPDRSPVPSASRFHLLLYQSLYMIELIM
jgi:hypothetical protein